MAATPHKIDSNSVNSKRPKKKKTPNQNSQRRQSSTTVNDLAAKIGLTPVTKSQPKTKPKVQNTTEKQQPKSSQLPSLQTQLDYARNGHAVMRNCIDPSKLVPIRQHLLHHGKEHELKAWQQKVEVAAGLEVSSRCQTLKDYQDELERIGITSDQLPFLQYFNTWQSIDCVHEMALELAETAAKLLDVPSVRLYQDSLFWKRAGDGPTRWHTDAKMAPFDTSSLVTLWIPLHDISRHGSALHFVSKSHSDFALPFWSPYAPSGTSSSSSHTNAWNQLEERYQHNPIVQYMPLAMGDLTAHSGWTLHCADSQDKDASDDDDDDDESSAPPPDSDRLALAISYVDARAPIRENVLMDDDHGDDEDQWSYVNWVKEVPAGEEFEHPLVPIVWPRN